jgi:hypothetical protein
MTYACPAWEFAADNHQLKLQRLQNEVLRTTGKFPRRTPVRDLHMALKLPYIYDYIIKLCSNKQKSYRIMKMEKANPDTGNTRGLNLAAVKCTTVQVTRMLL